MRLLLLVALCSALTSCYRTHYVNFSPENPARSAERYVPVRVTGWQSFFLWGWVPGERTIDAREKCGSSENIESIQTRRTFIEGLVATFAGYYVNIYSPWNGAVYCSEQP